MKIPKKIATELVRIARILVSEEIASKSVNSSNEIVLYKGRKYILLWKGKTKYGDKAHLSFMDKSKSFWVPISALGASPLVVKDVKDYSKSQGPKSCSVDWPRSKCCPICGSRHSYAPCGYPGCSPHYCDECDGGGRYCKN